MSDRPPVLARLALRGLLPKERLEEVEGDLLELFHARLAESGRRRARMRYWVDAASVLRRLRRQPRAGERREREGISMRAMSTELRYAWRALAKHRGYAGIAAFTLALGIGSCVAIFAVLNAVLIRPLPYPDADRIVEVLHHAPGSNLPDVRSSPGLVARYRESARTLAHVAGYEIRQLNLTGSGPAERVRALAATPSLFDVLAIRPALGRRFDEHDGGGNAPRVTILTDAIWRSRFGGDPAILGRTVQLDGEAVEIVGVMPRGFSFPDIDTRLLVPLRIDAHAAFGAFGMASIARLAPGVTLDAARREISWLQQRIPEWFPGIGRELLAEFGWSSAVVPLHERVVASVSTTLWILFATVGLVLLVAAANVANLFLVRAESRQREVAVKAALGASRSRVAAGFLAESLVLGAIGGLAGLLLADAATRLLVAYGPPRLPRLHEVRLDGAAVAFAATLSVATAAVLAALPALGLARRAAAMALRDGGRGTTAGRARHRARQLLIVAQVAMALVLLVGAGLMVRSIVRLSAVDPGFRVQGLLTAAVSLGARTDHAEAVRRHQRLLEGMARVPGVAAVGGANSLPIGASSLSGSGFEIRSRPRSGAEPPLFTMYSGITAGYFETLGVPLLAGRAIAQDDIDRNRAVAWVNRTFTSRFLGDRPLGETISIADQWVEIVGVVGDLRTSGLRDDIRPMVYLPASHPAVKLDVLYAVVRTPVDPSSLAPSIRNVVDRVDPAVPLTFRTMDEIVSASLARTAFTVTLVAIAAGIGLVLGVVGLYGAISYIASQRTAEIGVRLALGATPGRVCVMVIRQGALVAAAGIAVGLAAAWSSARFMSSMLFGVSTHDPATYATVAALLTTVCMIATLLPARKAAGVDPVRALRHEG